MGLRGQLEPEWQRRGGKWREISGLLLNKGIPLARRGMAFDACIRSVMLYGGETWALTKRLEGVLIGCDRRMLRYMAGVTRQDQVSSEEVWGGDVGGCSSEKIGVFGTWRKGMSGTPWEGFSWSRFLVIDRQADQRKHLRKIWRRS